MKNQILVLSIIVIMSSSLILQDASASILSASMKNPPQATADLLTLNDTSGTHLFWINSNGKLFAENNADFTGSTSVFDSSKFCIRNPASTFTTCLTNSAITANRTLTWPLITTTDTLATLGLAQTFTGSNTVTGLTTVSRTASAATDTLILQTNGMTNNQIVYFVLGANTTNNNGFSFAFNENTASNARYFGIQPNEASIGGGLKLYASGTLALGNANVTTSATDGFINIPTTAGTPTGTPTSITGSKSMVFDGTHNKLCVYNGGWKCAILS